uniref:Uncharacterized protein n=1 Tax=Rhizophora mucronata TaxID=61149 RepID=A0A2P2JJB5_RHIMU
MIFFKSFLLAVHNSNLPMSFIYIILANQVYSSTIITCQLRFGCSHVTL